MPMVVNNNIFHSKFHRLFIAYLFIDQNEMPARLTTSWVTLSAQISAFLCFALICSCLTFQKR